MERIKNENPHQKAIDKGLNKKVEWTQVIPLSRMIYKVSRPTKVSFRIRPDTQRYPYRKVFL